VRYVRDSKAVPFPLTSLVKYESARDIVGYVCRWETGYTAWQLRHRVLVAPPGGGGGEYAAATAYAGLPLCIALPPGAPFAVLARAAARWAALCAPPAPAAGETAAVAAPAVSYCITSQQGAAICPCGDANCCVRACVPCAPRPAPALLQRAPHCAGLPREAQ
jgi:hypothetical protein